MSRPPPFQEQLPSLFGPDQPATLPDGRLPSYIAGHRKRLRARFMEGGAAAMPDYELLELLLFRSTPRSDVKPLARALLDEFGDFNRVLTAAPERLAKSSFRAPPHASEVSLGSQLSPSPPRPPVIT